MTAVTIDESAPAVLAADCTDAVPELRGWVRGFAVERAATVAAVRAAVRDAAFDCVLVTAETPDGAWRSCLEAVRTVDPTLPVVLVTPAGSERLAAAAVETDVTTYVNLAAESDPGVRVREAVEAVVETGCTNGRGAVADSYRTLVEAAGDPMYVLDADGTVVMCNGAMAERVGRPERELVGASVEQFTTAESVAAADAAIERLLANGGGTHETVEVELHTAAGERVPCEVSLAPVRDETGRVVGSVGVVRDITERLARERELERYKRLFEAVPDVIFVFDAAGTVVTTNEPAADVFGIDRTDLIGRSATELFDTDVFGDDAVQRYREAIFALRHPDADAPGRFEVDLTLPDGECRTYEVHVTLRSTGGAFRGTVGVMRDVTERTRRTAELERQNERLERFASVVSHDLRNPLEVARGRLELAREDGDRRHFDRVERALDRMESIVDDLLALARQGTAVRETESVRLDRVARAAWAVVETGDATFSVETDRAVRADRSRLQQLFENCVRNAVEHGSTSSRTESDDAVEHGSTDTPDSVSVRVGLVTDDAGTPTGFFVEDDGPGVPSSQREHLFEYGHTTADDGTGLGLAIVKDIVDAHGWDVRVTDARADGTGARFEIAGVTFDD